jgi:phosphoglycerate dehydrogenase-like enzyme
VDIEEDVFGPNACVLAPRARHASDISDEIWASADAILAWYELQFTAQVIAKLERCQVIVRVGIGVDNVDLEAAGRRGIPVCNVPDYCTTEVADHTMGLILALARGIYAFSERLRASDEAWNWHAAGKLNRLTGARLGIIGLGRIGTAVALRAKAFGIEVLFYDPYLPAGIDKSLGVTRCHELPDLLSQVDIVSFHTPLTAETENMADSAFLAKLKPGAILVNTARGAIVQLDALAEVLRSGHLRGAGLDVLPWEPPDPNHPLIRAWRAGEDWIAQRLIITPHSAFMSEEAYSEVRRKAAEEAKRVLAELPPRNCVNLEWLESRE